MIWEPAILQVVFNISRLIWISSAHSTVEAYRTTHPVERKNPIDVFCGQKVYYKKSQKKWVTEDKAQNSVGAIHFRSDLTVQAWCITKQKGRQIRSKKKCWDFRDALGNFLRQKFCYDPQIPVEHESMKFRIDATPTIS